MQLSLAEIRHLALACQGLNGRWVLPDGQAGAAEVVRRLGYVQIDTLHVVHRAHHHVVWSRFRDYQTSMLRELLAEDRRLFEWWTHAAAYIPMEDFRFYAPRMGDRALSDGQKAWAADNQEVLDRVLARIRVEGALGTSAFQAPEGATSGSWWSGWKPAKRALEVMFNQGILLVSERRNFERIYDLRERVVPEGADRPRPDAEETADYLLRRALLAYGALPDRHLWWWRLSRPGDGAVERAISRGLVTPIEVEGQDDEAWYAWSPALVALDQVPAIDAAGVRRMYILSPFDNLIIRRPLMETVFGFDYRMECYLPKAKRQYGYFALPILWGDRFIGRVDTKADRKGKVLVLKQLTFEVDLDDSDLVLAQLAAELRAFAAFNECDAFAVELVSPERLKVPLEALLG